MKIKLVRLDAADEAAGLEFGQVFEATLSQNGGAIYYVVTLPPTRMNYFLRSDQVEAINKGNQ